MTETLFSPGSLVTARGREWVVLTGSTEDTLMVRPSTGGVLEQTLIYLPLEEDPVLPAQFALPSPEQVASHDAAVLLRDALQLSLRRGAGPFRSFGQLAVQPRAYQLVPLMMALRLDPIRLLIADDVGIGKTIEALLIARELLDRGEVERLTVLCPPHLVEQWVTELDARFHLQAVAVTARSATRLERDLPQGVSLFTVYPFTVVSLDYIKSQDRREHFLTTCPELVIVDEAHTCTGTGQGRHQRYELMHGLAASAERHMIFLTATPHSGDDDAFYRLLGLLDGSLSGLRDATDKEREALRERLARHLVQRRRPDISEWHEPGLFPVRKSLEVVYRLTGAWDRFFQAVLDYCAEIVIANQGDSLRQRLNFWSTLALLRCASSSPMAAMLALRAHAGDEIDEEMREELLSRLFDGSADSLSDDDEEPPVLGEESALGRLIQQAETLAGQTGDPKLAAASEQLGNLLKAGASPVVFCRYIATAHYVARFLQQRFKNVTIGCITGELAPEQRKEEVDRLSGVEGQRLLVATDCLSEGINLQDAFDAVLHYDLSWNPTRHEQREGRVDRFGQPSKEVRTILLYGANNPVDGAVLEVILRKAARIREELGVAVPVPDEGHSLTQALMQSVLIRRREKLPETDPQQLTLFDRRLTGSAAGVRRSRTLFAQQSLKPAEVFPEFQKSLAAIGSLEDTRRFAERALQRLGGGLELLPSRGFRLSTRGLPDALRERLALEGIEDPFYCDFRYPTLAPFRSIQRSHPLISLLAETLLEQTLSPEVAADVALPAVLGRVGCWVSAGVPARTVVCLLRLRHQLTHRRGRKETRLLVEEAFGVAWRGLQNPERLPDDAALSLLDLPPADDVLPVVRSREISRTLQWLADRPEFIAQVGLERADALLRDHQRVREASRITAGSTVIESASRPDVMGVYILMPKLG